MNKVVINTENEDIILYLNKSEYYGYKFNKDNTIEKVNESVFNYFDFLICSNNYTKLNNEGNFQVILDNETNFKHYFKNGSEDYEMFYKNNGKSAILYINNDDEYWEISDDEFDDLKVFEFAKTSFSLSLKALLLSFTFYCGLTAGLDFKSNQKLGTTFKRNAIYSAAELSDVLEISDNSEDITLDKVKEKIYSSPNLNDEEKEFLYNEDLLVDVLPYINESNYSKFVFLEKITDIDIESYTSFMSESGYYTNLCPNKIYIDNYNEMDEMTKEVISHEFVHLCQIIKSYDYNMITESSAEMISTEYFESSKNNSYSYPIAVTRKLIEIIGPEAIWKFNFTGSFKSIEDEVKPYFTEEEFLDFKKNLKFNPYEIDMSQFARLNELLDILYKKKYSDDPLNNKVFYALDTGENLVKYYFNKKNINQENSFYEDWNNPIEKKYTIDEAIEKDLVTVYGDSIKIIQPSEAWYEKNINKKNIICDIKYNTGFIELSKKLCKDGLFISGIYNNEIVTMSEKEMIEKGLIESVLYYTYGGRKVLTKEEYSSGKYFNFVFLAKDGYLIEDDKVVEIVPNKVYIPPINENSLYNMKTR